jgi:hypothetical protein
MRTLTILFTLIYGFTCHAQNISYDDLSSLDLNNYPFSVVEILLDNGFEFAEKRSIENSPDIDGNTSDSLYELSYSYSEGLNLIMGAFVCADEMNSDKIPTSMPILKLVFMHEKKDLYIELSDEIKKACGEPDSGFYFAPNSLAYNFKKELVEGEPVYYIYIDFLTKEKFEAMKMKLNELLEMMNESDSLNVID